MTPVRGLDGKTKIPESAIQSVNTNKIGLKGRLSFITGHITGCMQTGKSGKIISKSPKVGKVREFEKNVVPGQGKSGKIVLPKYLIRVVN